MIFWHIVFFFVSGQIIASDVNWDDFYQKLTDQRQDNLQVLEERAEEALVLKNLATEAGITFLIRSHDGLSFSSSNGLYEHLLRILHQKKRLGNFSREERKQASAVGLFLRDLLEKKPKTSKEKYIFGKLLDGAYREGLLILFRYDESLRHGIRFSYFKSFELENSIPDEKISQVIFQEGLLDGKFLFSIKAMKTHLSTYLEKIHQPLLAVTTEEAPEIRKLIDGLKSAYENIQAFETTLRHPQFPKGERDWIRSLFCSEEEMQEEEKKTCPICWTDDSPIDLHPCGHGCCRSCFDKLLQRSLESGSWRCPDPSCKADWVFFTSHKERAKEIGFDGEDIFIQCLGKEVGLEIASCPYDGCNRKILKLLPRFNLPLYQDVVTCGNPKHRFCRSCFVTDLFKEMHPQGFCPEGPRHKFLERLNREIIKKNGGIECPNCNALCIRQDGCPNVTCERCHHHFQISSRYQD